MAQTKKRSSARWADYFARNAGAPRGIPWERGVRWSPDERRAVAASVQEFQLGEQSEGRHLRRCAARHAAATGDARYTDAVELFIGEEKRHAAELARLLGLAGVGLKTSTPVDTVFRGLRKLRLRADRGLETCIRVLVAAEVIATTYYDALGRATACPVTRALCARILRDEAAHVRFHAERLAQLGAGRGPAARAAADAAHRALLAATCGVVWLGPHRRVLRRGGYSFARFTRESRRLLDRRVLAVADARPAPSAPPPSRAPPRRTRSAPSAAPPENQGTQSEERKTECRDLHASRFSSDARRATLHPDPLGLRLVDAAGRTYGRDRAAERRLGLTPVPPGVGAPRLRAGLADPVRRPAEGLLPRGADGFLHAPVTFAL